MRKNEERKMKQQYNFYPTLLNNFKDYQDMKMYGERMAYDEPGILDAINKKPFLISDAILKGQALEKHLQDGSPLGRFEKDFEPSVLVSLRAEVAKGVWQVFVEYTHELPECIVRWYGFIDVLQGTRTLDVKSTSQYDFPKFLNSFQHKVYMLGCDNMGIEIKDHIYLATTGREWYKESYHYQKDKFIADLTTVSRDLISFCELHRNEITSPRIFNEQKDERSTKLSEPVGLEDQ